MEVCDGVDPFVSEAVELLETIPGVGERAAETIVSEIGVDTGRFPSDQHLSRVPVQIQKEAERLLQ